MEFVFLPILFLITSVVCYLATSIMVNKLGIDGLGGNIQYYQEQSNAFSSFVDMPLDWLNEVVYIQMDALSLSTDQTFIVNLIDPNTVPEGSKVTIFNNLTSANNPVNNTVEISYILDPPCPSRYTFDNVAKPYTCGFCPPDQHYVHNPNNPAVCLYNSNDQPSSFNPLYTDPLLLKVTIGAGQGATFITHRFIPYTGFFNNGSITFDLTPPEFQLRTWKLFQYIQPTCANTNFCSTNNNLPTTNCQSNLQCPNDYPLNQNAVPNSFDYDVTPQNCTYQLCNCPTGTKNPFCT